MAALDIKKYQLSFDLITSLLSLNIGNYLYYLFAILLPNILFIFEGLLLIIYFVLLQLLNLIILRCFALQNYSSFGLLGFLVFHFFLIIYRLINIIYN